LSLLDSSDGDRYGNGLACHQAVQDVGTKIDLVGPHDGSGFMIYLNSPKEFHILQRSKYTASSSNSLLEVNLAFRAVGKTQLKAIFLNVADLADSRENASPVY